MSRTLTKYTTPLYMETDDDFSIIGHVTFGPNNKVLKLDFVAAEWAFFDAMYLYAGHNSSATDARLAKATLYAKGNHKAMIANYPRSIDPDDPESCVTVNALKDAHDSLETLYRITKAQIQHSHINWRTINLKQLDQRSEYEGNLYVSIINFAVSAYLLKNYL